MKRLITILSLVYSIFIMSNSAEAIISNPNNVVYKYKTPKTIVKKVKPVGQLFLPPFNQSKKDTLFNGLKVCLEVLILYSLVIQVVKIVDSVNSNQYDDLPVQHQIFTFIAYLSGLIMIPYILDHMFVLPDIIPFKYK